MLRLTLNETMSGFLSLNASPSRTDFSFSICAVFESINPFVPMPFEGTFKYGTQTGSASGTLTLKPTGPRYEIDMYLPDVGQLRLAGEKTYTLSQLKYSLTTCPLTVYKSGKPVGFAEVAYRDGMLEFPFKALKLKRG